MADVSITIRKSDGSADSSVTMSGKVEDALLSNYLKNITQLVAASIGATAAPAA